MTKQSKMSPNIWSGRDMRHYILLIILDKDRLHSSLGVGFVPGFVVLGPVLEAVPTGPVPEVAPRLVILPPGPRPFTLRVGQ